VKPEVLPPALFGPVHGGVGVHDERLGVQAVGGINTDTDAGRDAQFVAMDGIRRRQLFQDSAGHSAGEFHILDVLEKDHKLIAALPADRILSTHTTQQPPGHGLKKIVAGGVPERVVDPLKAIQIQE
jgi:hypothetical protein